MSRYISSKTEYEKLNNSLGTLTEQIENHKNIVKRNNKELALINKEMDEIRVDKIVELEEKIKKLESETRWVKRDEAPVKNDKEHLLRKLDIL